MSDFVPPERPALADALETDALALAARIGDALGDAGEPIVVDRRRRVDLPALLRRIDDTLREVDGSR